MATFGLSNNSPFGLSTSEEKKLLLPRKSAEKQNKISGGSEQVQIKRIIDGDTLVLTNAAKTLNEKLRAKPAKEGYGFGAAETPHGAIDPATQRRLNRIKNNMEKRDGESFFGLDNDDVFTEGKQDTEKLQEIVDQAWSSPEADVASANMEDDYSQPYPVMDLVSDGARGTKGRLLGDLRLRKGSGELAGRDIFGDVLNTEEDNLDYNENWNAVKRADDVLAREAALYKAANKEAPNAWFSAEEIDKGDSLLHGPAQFVGGVLDTADTIGADLLQTALNKTVRDKDISNKDIENWQSAQTKNMARQNMEYEYKQLTDPGEKLAHRARMLTETQLTNEEQKLFEQGNKVKRSGGNRSRTAKYEPSKAERISEHNDNLNDRRSIIDAVKGDTRQNPINTMIGSEISGEQFKAMSGNWDKAKKSFDKGDMLDSIASFASAVKEGGYGFYRVLEERPSAIADVTGKSAPYALLMASGPGGAAVINSFYQQNINAFEKEHGQLPNLEESGVALASAIGAAAFERVGGSAMGLYGKTAKAQANALKKAEKASKQGMPTRLAKKYAGTPAAKLFKGVAGETVTEMGQTALEEYAAKQGSKPVSGENIYTGGVLGGLAGGAITSATIVAKPAAITAAIGVGATALVGQGVYAAAKGITNVGKNIAADRAEKTSARNTVEDYAAVKEEKGITEVTDSSAENYDPSKAIESLLSVTGSVIGNKQRKLHMEELDAHTAIIEESLHQLDPDNSSTDSGVIAEKERIQTYLDSVATTRKKLDTDAAAATKEEIDEVLSTQTKVSDTESDKYNPFKAVKETRKLYKELESTPEGREAYLNEMDTHVANLKQDAESSGDKALLSKTARAEKALAQDRIKLDKTAKREEKYSSPTKHKKADVVGSVKDAVSSAASIVKTATTAYDKIVDPNDDDYNPSTAFDASVSNKNIKDLTPGQRAVRFEEAEEHLAKMKKGIDGLVANGVDKKTTDRATVAHDNKARQLEDLRKELVKKSITTFSKDADNIKAATSAEEVPPELVESLVSNLSSVMDTKRGEAIPEELLSGELSKSTLGKVSDEVQDTIEAAEDLAQSIQKAKDMQGVGEEVLGAGVNNMGKRGIKGHLAAFNEAISSNNTEGARGVLRTVAAFRDSQIKKLEKLKTGTYINKKGEEVPHEARLINKVEAELQVIYDSITFMQKRGKSAFGVKDTNPASAKRTETRAANKKAQPKPKPKPKAKRDHKKDLSKITKPAQLIGWLKGNQTNKATGLLLDKLAELIPNDITVSARENLEQESTDEAGNPTVIPATFAGRWSPSINTLFLNLSANRYSDAASSIEPAIHELTHVATSAVINTIEGLIPKGLTAEESIAVLATVPDAELDRVNISKEQIEAYNKLRNLLEELQNNKKVQAALKHPDNKGMSTATMNVKELIAQGLTGPAFQKLLKEIQVTPQSTAWDDFIASIAGLLGLSDKAGNALTEVMQASSSLIDATINNNDEFASTPPQKATSKKEEKAEFKVDPRYEALPKSKGGWVIFTPEKGSIEETLLRHQKRFSEVGNGRLSGAIKTALQGINYTYAASQINNQKKPKVLGYTEDNAVRAAKRKALTTFFKKYDAFRDAPKASVHSSDSTYLNESDEDFKKRTGLDWIYPEDVDEELSRIYFISKEDISATTAKKEEPTQEPMEEEVNKDLSKEEVDTFLGEDFDSLFEIDEIDEADPDQFASNSDIPDTVAPIHKENYETTAAVLANGLQATLLSGKKQDVFFRNIKKSVGYKENVNTRNTVDHFENQVLSGAYKVKGFSPTVRQISKSTLIPFMEKYGFEMHNAEKFLVNLARRDVKGNINNATDMAKALASPIIQLMYETPIYKEAIESIEQTPEYKKALAVHVKRFANRDRRILTTNFNKKILKELLESGFKKEIARRAGIEPSIVRKLINFVKDVFNLIRHTDITAIDYAVDRIIDNTFEDPDYLSVTPKEGYVKVDFKEAFASSKVAQGIMSAFGTRSNVVLTGSIAYATQGTVYRNQDTVIHDLDFLTRDMEQDDIHNMVMEEYPEATLAYSFFSGNQTDTYLIPPAGFSIGKVHRLEGTTKIGGYTILDKNGKVKGTYRLKYDEDENGKRINEEEIKHGEEAMLVDFFSRTPNKVKSITHPFVNSDGKNVTVQLAAYETAFMAKLVYSRPKDIIDYAQFVPNEIGKALQKPNQKELSDDIQDSTDSIKEPVYSDAAYKKTKPIFDSMWAKFKAKGENLSTMAYHLTQRSGENPVIIAMLNQYTSDHYAAISKNALPNKKTETVEEEDLDEVSVRTQKWITRKDLKDNPDTIYLFGDNLQQRGLGGQAKEMRGEPNSVGIPTKKAPSMSKESFFTDEEYEANIAAIDAAFEKIPANKSVVIPEAGLGTNLADLQNKAPKTFQYLQNKIDSLLGKEVVIEEEISLLEALIEESTPTEVEESVSTSAVADIAKKSTVTEDITEEVVEDTVESGIETILSDIAALLAVTENLKTKKALQTNRQRIADFLTKAKKGTLTAADEKTIGSIGRYVAKEYNQIGSYTIPSATHSKLNDIPGYMRSNIQTMLNELASTPMGNSVLKKERDDFVEEFIAAIIADNSVKDIDKLLREKSNDLFARNGYGNTLLYSRESQNNTNNLAVRKGNTGVFAKVPNFWSLMTNSRLRAGIFESFGIEGSIDFSKEGQKHSITNIVEEFSTRFNKLLAKEYTKGDIYEKDRNRLYDLINGNDRFSENVGTVAALVANNWLLTRSGDTLYNDAEEVHKMLGLEEGRIEDTAILHKLGSIGSRASAVEQELGELIARQLGIYAPKGAPTLTDLQLHMALGQLAIGTLNTLGYVKLSSVTDETLKIISKNSEESSEAKTVFVRVTPDEKSHYKMHPYLVDMQESFSNYKEVLESMLGIKSMVVAPSFEPITKVATNYGRGVTEISENTKEGVAFAQKQSWEAKKSTMPLYHKMSGKSMRKIGGYVEEVDAIDILAPSIEGKNLSIATAYDNMKTWMDMGGHDNPFYFAYDVWKNTRMGIISNMINVQAMKMHRHMYGLSAFTATIDAKGDPDTYQGFKMAVALAFGQSIDTNYPHVTEEWFDNLQHNEKVMKAVEILNSDTAQNTDIKYTAAEEDILLDAIDEGKEEYFSMDGLAAYAAYVKADGTPFTTDIFVETDGKTNGVISLYRQLPGGSFESMQDKLNRGGVFFEGQSYNNYMEYINKVGNTDSYEALASHVGPILTGIKKNILEKTVAWSQVKGNKFYKGVGQEFGSVFPFIRIPKKNPNNPKYLESDLSLINPTHIATILDTFSLLIGDFASEIEDVVSNVVEEAGIDPSARKWAKDPLLTKSYGAGGTSISRKKEKELLETVYGMIDTARGGTLEEQTKVAHMLTRMTRYEYTAEELFGDNDNAMKFSFDKNEKEVIHGQVEALIKNTLDTALYNELGKVSQNVNWMNTAARVSSEIFVRHFDNRVTAAEKKLGRPVAQKEVKELYTKFRDEGLLPGMKHATSEGHKDSLQIIKEEKVAVTGMKPVQTTFTQPIHIDALELGDNNEIVSTGVHEQKSISNTPTRFMPIGNVGVGTVINGNLSQDGNTQASVMQKYPVLNVHDASGYNAGTVKEGTNYTEQVWEGHQNSWSMSTAIGEKLNLLVASMEDLTEEQVNELYNLFATESKDQIKVGNAIPNEPGFTFSSLEEFVAEFTEVTEQINTLKDEVDSKVGVTQQYPYPGSEFVQENTSEESSDDIPDVVNSTDQAFDRAAFDERYKDNLNKDTASKVFSDIKFAGTSPENDAHTNTLRKVLNNVINPALSRLDSFQILRGVYPDKNTGYIDAQNVYIGAGNGVATLASDMSSQETLTQGLLQALLEAGLEGNTWAKRELNKLYALAEHAKDDQGKQIITPESFLRKDAAGKVILTDTYDNELAAAQDRYDAVFDSSMYPEAYLRNFAALGLTNEAFMADLAKISQKNPTLLAGKTFSEKVIAVISNMLDTLFSAGFKTRGKPADQALYALVQNITNVNEEHKKKAQDHEIRWNKYNGITKQKLHKYVYGPYVKYTTSRIGKSRTANKFRVIADGIISIPAYAMSADFQKQRMKTYGRLHAVEGSISKQLLTMARSLTHEIRGRTEANSHWHNFVRESKHVVDSLRERGAALIKEQTRELFDPNEVITEQGWESLNAALLKTDISSVIKAYSWRELATLFESNPFLDREIANIEGKLGRYGAEARGYYIAQSDSLGHYMARGTVGLDGQKFNAYNIANHIGTLIPTSDSTEQAEELINHLATLYSIRYTAKNHRDYMAERVRHEYAREVDVNGIEFMLATHESFKKESLAKNFDDNKIQMVKGYTKESYNDMYQQAVSVSDNDRDLIQGGFELIGKIETDANDPNKKPRFMYRSKHGQMNRYQAGGVSQVNTVAKGSDLIDVAMQTGEKNHAYTTAQKNGKFMHSKVQAKIRKQFSPGAKPDYSKNYMVPIFNNVGLTTNYRYVMSEANKINLMGKKDLAHDVLGNMVASVEAKANSNEMNLKALKLAKDDYDADFENNSDEFIYIGEDSLDEKNKERWQLLPAQMRRDMQTVWGKKGMYIKEDYMNMVLGFRKLSFTDAIDNQIGLSPRMKTSMHISGKIWQAIVAMAKRRIVILTPAVLAANVTSNIMLSLAKGMPLKYILKHQVAALTDLAAYQRDVNARDKLQNILNISPNLPNRKAQEKKLARLTSAVDTNIVSELVSQGIFQSIIEDVDTTQTTELMNIATTAFPAGEGTLDYLSNATPEIIKDGYKILTLDADTKLGNALMKATQYSDFVARYALYKYQTEVQKKDKQTSLEDVVDTFVNYDENTNPEVQYLNDMGIMMYTKFLFRIQRVILRSFKEKPAEALALQAAQIALWNVPDIPESNLITNEFIERMHLPFSPDTLDDAFTLSLLNYIPFL